MLRQSFACASVALGLHKRPVRVVLGAVVGASYAKGAPASVRVDTQRSDDHADSPTDSHVVRCLLHVVRCLLRGVRCTTANVSNDPMDLPSTTDSVFPLVVCR